MGIEIKRKKMNGVEMYQLRSTISDELYHTEDWVTVDGAKKALMESKVWNFAEELVKVDMEFPDFYHVNGKPPKAYSDKTLQRFCEYALNNYYSKGGGKKLDEEFQAILKKFNIEIENKPQIQFGLFRSNMCNFGKNKDILEAISDNEEKLKEFCKVNFGEEVDRQKREDTGLTDFFIIQPYKMKVV